MPSTQTIINWTERIRSLLRRMRRLKRSGETITASLWLDHSAGLQGKYKDSAMLRAAIMD